MADQKSRMSCAGQIMKKPTTVNEEVNPSERALVPYQPVWETVASEMKEGASRSLVPYRPVWRPSYGKKSRCEGKVRNEVGVNGQPQRSVRRLDMNEGASGSLVPYQPVRRPTWRRKRSSEWKVKNYVGENGPEQQFVRRLAAVRGEARRRRTEMGSKRRAGLNGNRTSERKEGSNDGH